MDAGEWWGSPPPLVTKGEFAADCEVTRGAVSQWVARGLPVLSCGHLDYRAACDWVVENLDPGRAVKAHRTSRRMRQFLINSEMERRRLRAAVLVCAAAAAEAGRGAGLSDAAAARLADEALAVAVPAVNEIVREAGAEPLAPAPDGVWRVARGLRGDAVLDLIPDRAG